MKQRPTYKFKASFKPYLLNPNGPEGMPINEYLEKKYGRKIDPTKKSPLDIAGESVGIKFNSNRAVHNTLASHRLNDYAERFGKQDETINELFKIYFEEAKNINNIDILVEVAEKFGIPKAREFLLTDEGATKVNEGDYNAKHEIGVDGVPFFIIGREDKEEKLAFSGAQPIELFLRAFDKIMN